ncbi:MAG: DNA replication/repair protein RecF [Syntrophomonadaceae bacterium]|nr:DNA replication/repair protein RecF [Syntrophomonadaceae bacterium]
MYISEIIINNFRNLERIRYEPARGINILLGKNAQGKTNFLEAIYLLASGSSFRSVLDRDLIRLGQNCFSIQATYHYLNKKHSISVQYTSGKRKQFTINNKRYAQTQDRLAAVLFTPDDLYLIKGPPQKRRAFIDNLLKSVSPEYRTSLENYEQLLNRRNTLLKGDLTDPGMLRALDHIFSSIAAQITLARLNLIKILDELTLRFYKLLGGSEELQLKYALTFKLPGGKVNLESIREIMVRVMQEKYIKERQRKTTLIGPHRDDVNFYLNQKNARVFASQGQQRNIVVVLKLAELEVFRRMRGTYPILLLDEILAELDIEKRETILDFLTNSSFQTFMTSVDGSLFNNINGKMVWLEQGRLLE